MEFDHAVATLREATRTLGMNPDELRVETQVESLKDWSLFADLSEVKNWFLEQQSQSSMNIKDIPLFECEGWYLCEDTGYIKHQSGDFFQVQGVRVTQKKEREVIGGWDQPMVAQIGYDGGLLGILRKRFKGVPHYLVDAKAEPGNPDGVQISPTLQATFSNLRRAHGGRKPHFAQYFETPEQCEGRVLYEQWMSEDGGRLHLKRNKGMLVEVPQNSVLPELPSTFSWVSLYQIKALIKQNSWVNPHVRGIISHL